MKHYYDGGRALSYNAILTFTVSVRGNGKTYFWKGFCLDRFIKNGETFVWVRRYADELDEAVSNDGFLKDIRSDARYKGHELKSDGKFVYVDGNVAGEFVALTRSQKYKSRSFADVGTVVFDEFILDTSTNRRQHYISQREPELFVDLLNTIFRSRPVRAICLANAISFNNPYFIYYGVKPTQNRFTWQKARRLLVELYTPDDFIEEASKTDIGLLTNGTNYGAYALHNKFLLDSDTFIEKRSKNAHFICGVHTSTGDIGFWYDRREGLVYTSFQTDSGRPYLMYTLERDDHTTNMLFIKNALNTPLSVVVDAWKYGLLRFDDTRVKARAFGVLAYFV